MPATHVPQEQLLAFHGDEAIKAKLGLDRNGLQRELLGERAAPSHAEVIALIPPEKLIVLESA